MLPRFFLIAVVVVASLSGAVAAQDTNATAATNTTAEQPETCSRSITPSLRLCSADYVDGEAVLIVDSETRDRVTVTEAANLNQPRELNRDSFIVDGKTEIRLAVRSTNGRAAVTIDTGAVLYGVPVRTENTLIGGPFTASDAQAAGLGGGLGVAAVTIFLVARTVYGRTEEPERMA
ncbi:ORF6 [Halorubrum pleomorphic virus 6]|uniref:ORF6 n=1 Tax=Halorubrum pleomorphic virus 6 TaxID=1156721 RepID=H9ABP7_9VIRU|nr:ORF6 [Halorubrum pleomorphic virus 6]AFD04017.1 ORF6 [Halorubrum pleomorphic virus 6]